MRLIDADALLKEIGNAWEYANPMTIIDLITTAPTVEQGKVAELEAENKQIDAINASLQANINVLREALEYQKTRCEDVIDIRLIDEALASTPAQALQAHDNEVIELKAHINVLREALEYHTEQTRPIQKTIDALASTPAQLLQAHDNEILTKEREEIIATLEYHGSMFADEVCEDYIRPRLLKGKL